MAQLTLVVEGDTDVPFARKIAAAAGWVVGTVIDKGGKPNLDRDLSGYNAAARYSPWLVLRDLDRDAPCAPELVSRLLPSPSPFMCFRIPVRAIEAWALGDSERLATHLKVREGMIPLEPELERDPKQSLVSIARRSTSMLVRRDLVPKPGARRKAGPGYEAHLIEFGAEHWRWREAQKRCPSLKGCIAALRRLRKALEQT